MLALGLGLLHVDDGGVQLYTLASCGELYRVGKEVEEDLHVPCLVALDVSEELTNFLLSQPMIRQHLLQFVVLLNLFR